MQPNPFIELKGLGSHFRQVRKKETKKQRGDHDSFRSAREPGDRSLQRPLTTAPVRFLCTHARFIVKLVGREAAWLLAPRPIATPMNVRARVLAMQSLVTESKTC